MTPVETLPLYTGESVTSYSGRSKWKLATGAKESGRSGHEFARGEEEWEVLVWRKGSLYLKQHVQDVHVILFRDGSLGKVIKAGIPRVAAGVDGLDLSNIVFVGPDCSLQVDSGSRVLLGEATEIVSQVCATQGEVALHVDLHDLMARLAAVLLSRAVFDTDDDLIVDGRLEDTATVASSARVVRRGRILGSVWYHCLNVCCEGIVVWDLLK